MADSKAPAEEVVSGGEKCSDLCEKIGTLCKVGAAVTCGSLSLTTVKVGTGDVKTFKKVGDCIGSTYQPYFEKFGSKPFLFNEGEKYTFKECFGIYEAVGAELRAGDGLGMSMGDSVGICMRNMPEFMLSFLAATSSGCRAVTLNSMWGTKEIEYAAKDSACKLIFCDQQRMDLILPFAAEIGCKLVLCGSKDEAAAEAGGAILWDKVVSAGKTKPKTYTKPSNATDDCMIMYTSGSTGNPKGVVHSQRSLGTGLVLQELAILTAKDGADGRSLLAVPLFHITAVVNVFLAAIAGGQQLHMMKKWDAGKALDLIEQHKITRFTGVPTMVRDMLEHPSFTPERMASIKQMAGGGAAVPPALMAKVRKATGGGGAQGYGLTETCGGIIVNKGLDAVKHPTSTGKCVPMLVSAVCKDPATGKDVKEGERGELCIRTAMVMSRYHNREEDTKKALDGEGWFHTGDVAKIEGGFVFILDRLKDLIIRGGENIDCTEIETKAFANPKVRECSVFGLPDERLGEVVGLAVWPTEPITAEELRTFMLATGLAKFKVPDEVNIFMYDEELPKGPTGKIDKKGMREKYADVVKARPAA